MRRHWLFFDPYRTIFCQLEGQGGALLQNRTAEVFKRAGVKFGKKHRRPEPSVLALVRGGLPAKKP